MAACSSGDSFLDSSPLVLRITYEELVAYADGLDRKEEKKNPKKKHQGEFEENESKPVKKLEKKDCQTRTWTGIRNEWNDDDDDEPDQC